MLGTSETKGLGSLKEPLMNEAGDARPPVSKRMSTASHVESAIVGAAEGVPNECVSATLKASGPIVAILVRILVNIAPFALFVYKHCAKIYKAAPKNALQMVFGLALCFYGGIFCASIAAIEAFRQMGWQNVYREVMVVTKELQTIWEAHVKDDAVDADKDGVPDVEQIAPSELAQRKMLLAMRTVTEPARLQSALGSLWAAYLAVLATLRLQFAQTVAIALGIVDSIHPPIMRLCVPPLSALLGPLEIGHWVETLLDASLKFIAILVAWTSVQGSTRKQLLPPVASPLRLASPLFASPASTLLHPRLLHPRLSCTLASCTLASCTLALAAAHRPSPIAPRLDRRPPSHSLQTIISAFYSAVRGGKLFASAGCALIIERGWQSYVEKLPGVPAPFDPETTKIDEVCVCMF